VVANDNSSSTTGQTTLMMAVPAMESVSKKYVCKPTTSCGLAVDISKNAAIGKIRIMHLKKIRSTRKEYGFF
jgi:hypothetical protein